MEIKLTLEETKGYFELYQDNESAAYLSFSIGGKDLIIIDHTDVKPQHKGKSFGKKLVYAAVDYARKNQIKIVPICPFASSVFQKEEEIRDVLR